MPNLSSKHHCYFAMEGCSPVSDPISGELYGHCYGVKLMQMEKKLLGIQVGHSDVKNSLREAQGFSQVLPMSKLTCSGRVVLNLRYNAVKACGLSAGNPSEMPRMSDIPRTYKYSGFSLVSCHYLGFPLKCVWLMLFPQVFDDALKTQNYKKVVRRTTHRSGGIAFGERNP